MNAALEKLRQRFRERCDGDRASLRQLAETGDVDGVRMLAHKLAGAAGTFGFSPLSEAASQLEEQVAYGEQPDPVLVDVLDAMLARVSENARA